MNYRRLLAPDRISINALLVGILALVVFFASKSPVFLSSSNFSIISVNTAVLAVVSAGLTALVIAGKADLSVGSVVGVSSVVASLSVAEWHLPALVGVVLGILTGAAVGAFNGVLCGVLGLNPIIVTLGTMTSLRGVTQLLRLNPVNGLGPTFGTIGSGTFLGVPVLVILAGAAFVAVGVALYLTPWGRYAYAIGVNRQAAFLSALPVRALPLWLYVVSGAFAGLGGVMLAARLDGTDPGSAGSGLEFAALTVVLLGGIAFDGGRGRLLGVFLAAVLLGILDNGLILLDVDQHVQEIVQGAALIIAAGLDRGGDGLVSRMAADTRVEQQKSAAPAPETEPATRR
jgi:ribose/xylose/arabinose/galactoside ABC-type transport system permease subunit